MVSQCDGTEKELVTKAKKLIAKVPFEKIKGEASIPDNSGPSIDVKQEEEPEISLILHIKLEEDEKEEENGGVLNYNDYNYSCLKCSKMFRRVEPCLEHMSTVCLVTPDDLPQTYWEKVWRRVLKQGAKLKADQVKIEDSENPSEEEIVAQIKKFYSANPTRKKKVVKHLRNIYGRKKFIKFGFGKLSEFIERHGL